MSRNLLRFSLWPSQSIQSLFPPTTIIYNTEEPSAIKETNILELNVFEAFLNPLCEHYQVNPRALIFKSIAEGPLAPIRASTLVKDTVPNLSSGALEIQVQVDALNTIEFDSNGQVAGVYFQDEHHDLPENVGFFKVNLKFENPELAEYGLGKEFLWNENFTLTTQTEMPNNIGIQPSLWPSLQLKLPFSVTEQRPIDLPYSRVLHLYALYTCLVSNPNQKAIGYNQSAVDFIRKHIKNIAMFNKNAHLSSLVNPEEQLIDEKSASEENEKKFGQIWNSTDDFQQLLSKLDESHLFFYGNDDERLNPAVVSHNDVLRVYHFDNQEHLDSFVDNFIKENREDEQAQDQRNDELFKNDEGNVDFGEALNAPADNEQQDNYNSLSFSTKVAANLQNSPSDQNALRNENVTEEVYSLEVVNNEKSNENFNKNEQEIPKDSALPEKDNNALEQDEEEAPIIKEIANSQNDTNGRVNNDDTPALDSGKLGMSFKVFRNIAFDFVNFTKGNKADDTDAKSVKQTANCTEEGFKEAVKHVSKESQKAENTEAVAAGTVSEKRPIGSFLNVEEDGLKLQSAPEVVTNEETSKNIEASVNPNHNKEHEAVQETREVNTPNVVSDDDGEDFELVSEVYEDSNAAPEEQKSQRLDQGTQKDSINEGVKIIPETQILALTGEKSQPEQDQNAIDLSDDDEITTMASGLEKSHLIEKKENKDKPESTIASVDSDEDVELVLTENATNFFRDQSEAINIDTDKEAEKTTKKQIRSKKRLSDGKHRKTQDLKSAAKQNVDAEIDLDEEGSNDKEKVAVEIDLDKDENTDKENIDMDINLEKEQGNAKDSPYFKLEDEGFTRGKDATKGEPKKIEEEENKESPGEQDMEKNQQGTGEPFTEKDNCDEDASKRSDSPAFEFEEAASTAVELQEPTALSPIEKADSEKKKEKGKSVESEEEFLNLESSDDEETRGGQKTLKEQNSGKAISKDNSANSLEQNIASEERVKNDQTEKENNNGDGDDFILFDVDDQYKEAVANKALEKEHEEQQSENLSTGQNKIEDGCAVDSEDQEIQLLESDNDELNNTEADYRHIDFSESKPARDVDTKEKSIFEENKKQHISETGAIDFNVAGEDLDIEFVDGAKDEDSHAVKTTGRRTRGSNRPKIELKKEAKPTAAETRGRRKGSNQNEREGKIKHEGKVNGGIDLEKESASVRKRGRPKLVNILKKGPPLKKLKRTGAAPSRSSFRFKKLGPNEVKNQEKIDWDQDSQVITDLVVSESDNESDPEFELLDVAASTVKIQKGNVAPARKIRKRTIKAKEEEPDVKVLPSSRGKRSSNKSSKSQSGIKDESPVSTSIAKRQKHTPRKSYAPQKGGSKVENESSKILKFDQDSDLDFQYNGQLALAKSSEGKKFLVEGQDSSSSDFEEVRHKSPMISKKPYRAPYNFHELLPEKIINEKNPYKTRRLKTSVSSLYPSRPARKLVQTYLRIRPRRSIKNSPKKVRDSRDLPITGFLNHSEDEESGNTSYVLVPVSISAKMLPRARSTPQKPRQRYFSPNVYSLSDDYIQPEESAKKGKWRRTDVPVGVTSRRPREKLRATSSDEIQLIDQKAISEPETGLEEKSKEEPKEDPKEEPEEEEIQNSGRRHFRNHDATTRNINSSLSQIDGAIKVEDLFKHKQSDIYNILREENLSLKEQVKKFIESRQQRNDGYYDSDSDSEESISAVEV